MNEQVAKSYFRSIQRGTRTMEQVPNELLDEVTRLYDEWMNNRVTVAGERGD